MTARPIPANDGAASPPETADAAALWQEALLCLSLFAVDPGLGLRLAARAGPVRQQALKNLRASLPPGEAWRKLPAGASPAALTGGLDLAASLAAGRPIAEKGLIAASDGGVIVAAMAERMADDAAGLLALALDRGTVPIERDGLSAELPARIGVLALDEGMEEDEAPPHALCERLGLWLSLDGADPRGSAGGHLDAAAIAAARDRLMAVRPDEAGLETICQAAMAFGIVSLRAPHLALRAACASAALAGRHLPGETDIETAIRLVLLPRATTLPGMPQDGNEDDLSAARDEEDGNDATRNEPPQDDVRDRAEETETGEIAPQDETLIEAADAGLPADLLKRLAAMARSRQMPAGGGRKGAFAGRARRGRAIGTRPGDPRRDRLDLVATLRAAAPWQTIRRRERSGRQTDVLPRPLEIRAADIQVRRHRGKAETATIFAVDASGSAALARLAEAKGAVERILAECYVRRDRVALAAFRGTRADVLLPETRSLTRAKRCLAALPAGGGTPLASGILAALDLAKASAREGRTPLIALLTDGRANISLAGAAGRPQAMEDARMAAAAVRASGIAALVIDLAQRPSEAAREIAAAMGASYLALPRADSQALAELVAAAPRGALASRAIARP
ncbi:magnesium chelatase subunit D [Jiella endophytica]|uniref:Magnesium chelatase subunit D n=1 Tax=Jiella endophytica TaxID=2558362 RepID=A0A4Y8RIF0_9HYPH|nr:magnesium chelatase subunit D [Jiella endophytica]TFF21764.1 magnesium chelatase subunit D [Jiella endophytica]